MISKSGKFLLKLETDHSGNLYLEKLTRWLYGIHYVTNNKIELASYMHNYAAIQLHTVCTSLLFVCCFTEIITDIIDDVLKPLLLSTVKSPPSSFINTVNSVINDINTVLDGKRVDLKVSIANYFKAVALFYVDDVLDLLPWTIRLSSRQKECASTLVFNHIYDNTESAAKLIDLMQNISVAVAVIKQVYKAIFITM